MSLNPNYNVFHDDTNWDFTEFNPQYVYLNNPSASTGPEFSNVEPADATHRPRFSLSNEMTIIMSSQVERHSEEIFEIRDQMKTVQEIVKTIQSRLQYDH
jgi:hypothetical protein